MKLATEDAWQGEFASFMVEFDDCFYRQEQAANTRLYVRGLMSNVKRKNGWQLAEAVGLADPHPLQRLLTEGSWDEGVVSERLRTVLMRQLRDVNGVAIIDESSFVKKGDKSAGVQRQYCGRLGKVENCQVGVFLGYVSPAGSCFLDRQLYIPQSWFEDQARSKLAKIPEGLVFKTKPELALELLERSWAEGLTLPWLVADSSYGNSPDFRQALHDKGCSYVLQIGIQHQVLQQDKAYALKDFVKTLSDQDWLGMVHGLGEKGPLTYAWTAKRIHMPHDELGEQWLLIRRNLDSTDQDLAYYLSNAPTDTKLEDLATVVMARHSIEQLFEQAKGELGLADYEVRSYLAWHRHMTLCMLAHSFLSLKQKKNSLATLV